jgi:hypothetical protein
MPGGGGGLEELALLLRWPAGTQSFGKVVGAPRFELGTSWSRIDSGQIAVVGNFTQQVAAMAHKHWSPTMLTVDGAVLAHPGAHGHI